MKKKKISVAVVGATGLVGRAFLRCMEKAEFVPEKLSLFASEKSDGQELEFNGEKHRVSALGKDSFAGVDLALFSAGGEVSGMYAPVAVSSGAVVIDNSSRWRMDKDVPLVVPETILPTRGEKSSLPIPIAPPFRLRCRSGRSGMRFLNPWHSPPFRR